MAFILTWFTLGSDADDSVFALDDPVAQEVVHWDETVLAFGPDVGSIRYVVSTRSPIVGIHVLAAGKIHGKGRT